MAFGIAKQTYLHLVLFAVLKYRIKMQGVYGGKSGYMICYVQNNCGDAVLTFEFAREKTIDI